jgi:ParB-like chromosome segregation protein Spo0J
MRKVWIKAMKLQYLPPTLLQPPHKVTRPEQVEALAQEFSYNGWNLNEPALVAYWDYNNLQLLSGTHRQAAAIVAKLETIPVVVHPYKAIKAAYGNLNEWDKIMSSGRVVERHTQQS